MRYRLRTLLIVLALGPPLIAGGWWGWREYAAWREKRQLEELSRNDPFANRREAGLMH